VVLLFCIKFEYRYTGTDTENVDCFYFYIDHKELLCYFSEKKNEIEDKYGRFQCKAPRAHLFLFNSFALSNSVYWIYIFGYT